jgi:hypothetical protein
MRFGRSCADAACSVRAKDSGVCCGRPVDEVHVDRFEAALAGRFARAKTCSGGLDAVDGLLYCGIEVLHAEAQAVEAQFGQRCPAGSDRSCAGCTSTSIERSPPEELALRSCA